ncbi:5'-ADENYLYLSULFATE REDUCTASE-LIKE 4-RELATED [Salix koriyanagi]|uniref:5'-ADENYLYLSULFATE REDUCTASE-LIKE 4-RELATED n=1 Tax=Salix koriyanagi TaxID=2511006 RepID=A0A9Q0P542_9ROSI|nr:5'-ADENYLYLSULFATE REDUCTASE-LIKE 4-RELATED [Salix koriyanagi]
MLMCATAANSNTVSICPIEPVTDSIFRFRDRNCVVSGVDESPFFPGVTEGDEVSLQKALNFVQKNSHEYVALLFYASWCPFSKNFRPSFSILSSLYPSIPHFEIEESSIRPSILSKYGVHGFPTLFLLNSTMRVRYHGSRTLGSLVAFYSDVTGIKTASLDKGSLDKIGHLPENLFREETYLALATTFVLLRLFYWSFPTALAFAQFTWRRHMQNMRLESLLEHPRAYLNRAIQLLNSLNEPCKKSNLQEGAMNARAWASKSLATVSIGDASTSRGVPVCECR